MAFIDVTTPKSPVAVAVPLLQCRAGKREFTPEVCQEVLQSTNFAKNIRDMLTMIAELPAEKQTDFKDVVLSTFDSREQPNDIIILGKKLAVAGGYEDELNNVGKIGAIDREYLLSGVGRCLGVTVDYVYQDCDYSRYEEVFVNRRTISLHQMDLSSIKKLRFKDGAKVELSEAQNLPVNLDISMCDYVDLSVCDLSPIKNLRFKDGACVDLSRAKNFPEDLDVSMCDKVDLQSCDLLSVKHLRFKDRAEVDLRYSRNLPEDLDVSMCDMADLSHCDLSAVKNLRFRDKEQESGSRVDIPDMVNVKYNYRASFVSMFKIKGR